MMQQVEPYAFLPLSVPIPVSYTHLARAEDGEIMAVEHKEYPVYGVQFHPESVMTPDGRKMIENFLERV